jgi:predicted transposase YdaD
VTEPGTPHDALFKWTFSHVERAASEFRAIFPPELLAELDLSTLHPVPAEFVDKALSKSYSDQLFEVCVRGEPGFLFVLFEHQSNPDDVMPLRLLGYIVRVLELYVRRQRTKGAAILPLPIVIPVVLHHGEQGWTRATRFEHLFSPALIAKPAIATLVPSFGFVLDDLADLTDNALRQRALDAAMRLALWALRDGRSPRLAQTVAGVLQDIAELLQRPEGKEVFEALFDYIIRVAEEAIAEEVLEEVGKIPEAKEDVMTLAEKLEARGRAEGRAEKAAADVLTVLDARSKALTAEQRAKIEACKDLALLDRWLRKAVTLDDASELFSEQQ